MHGVRLFVVTGDCEARVPHRVTSYSRITISMAESHMSNTAYAAKKCPNCSWCPDNVACITPCKTV